MFVVVHAQSNYTDTIYNVQNNADIIGNTW